MWVLVQSTISQTPQPRVGFYKDYVVGTRRGRTKSINVVTGKEGRGTRSSCKDLTKVGVDVPPSYPAQRTVRIRTSRGKSVFEISVGYI